MTYLWMASARSALLASAIVLGATVPAAGSDQMPAERPYATVIGSTLIAPFTEAISERLQSNAKLPPLKIMPTGTSKGVEQFCSGVGVDTPDVAAMSRRMRYHEFDACHDNGVHEIIEIQLGFEAIAVVTRLDDRLELSLGELYRALAAELPEDDDGFQPNPNRTWQDINPALPDTPIAALLPSPDLGARGFFNARVLQGACRSIYQINAIYEAEDRVKQCVTLRRDGRIGEIGLPYVEKMRAAFQAAKPGTIGIMSLRHAQELSDIVKIIPFDGHIASKETIADRKYEFIRPLYYYVKRAHVQDYNGIGPVVGLREFITEVTRESTIGPEGYLVPLGLVPMSETEREAVRAGALHLHAYSR